MSLSAPQSSPAVPRGTDLFDLAPDACMAVLDAAGVLTADLISGDLLATVERTNPALASRLIAFTDRVMELDNGTGFMAAHYFPTP